MTFSKLTTQAVRVSSQIAILALLVSTFNLGCSVDSRKGAGPTLGNQADFDKDPGTNFRVDAVTVASTVVAQTNSFGMVKAKTFNYKACIKDQAGNAILPDQVFTIADDQGGVVACQKTKYNPDGLCKADFAGCLNWSETHEYDFIADETYYRMRRSFTPVGVYRGRAYAEFAFNPWADNAAAIIDLRFNTLPANAALKDVGVLSTKGQRIMSKERPNIAIAINSAGFEFTGFDYPNYEVDQFLNLTVAHNYVIRIKPVITRRAIANPLLAVSLMSGRMKATIVLLKDDKNSVRLFNPNNVITTIEMVGTLTSLGELVATTSVKFDNVADITSRTQMLVTLAPMDELESLGEFSFIGYMKPGVLQAVSLQPTTANARDLVAKVRLSEQQDLNNKMTAFEKFKQNKNSGFVPMDLGVVPGASLADFPWSREADVKALMDQAFLGLLDAAGQKKLAQGLCIKVYGDWVGGNGRISKARANASVACTRDPAKYLRFGIREFVEKVNSKTPTPVGIPMLETFTMGVAMSKVESVADSIGHSTSLKGSWSASAGLDLGFGFGGSAGGKNFFNIPAEDKAGNKHFPRSFDLNPIKGGVSANLGARVSYGQEYFDTTVVSSNSTNSTTVSAVSNLTVTAEGRSFQLDVTSRPCLMAVPAYDVNVDLIQKANDNAAGVYYCAKYTRKQKHIETYYLIGQNVGAAGSPFSDSASASEVRWRMFMRGQASLNLFAAIVADKSLTLVLEKIPEAQMQDRFKSFYTSQEFEGLLSRD